MIAVYRVEGVVGSRRAIVRTMWRAGVLLDIVIAVVALITLLAGMPWGILTGSIALLRGAQNLAALRRVPHAAPIRVVVLRIFAVAAIIVAIITICLILARGLGMLRAIPPLFTLALALLALINAVVSLFLNADDRWTIGRRHDRRDRAGEVR